MKTLILLIGLTMITACGSGGGSESSDTSVGSSGSPTPNPSVADTSSPEQNVRPESTPTPDVVVVEPVVEPEEQRSTTELSSELDFDFRSVTSVVLNVNKVSTERVFLQVCQLQDSALDMDRCLLSTNLSGTSFTRELQFAEGSEGLGAKIFYFDPDKAPIEVFYEDFDDNLVWDLNISG